MQVSHYFEWEDQITGGHHQSVKNQRKILDRRGIDYTTSPRLDADLLHLNNMGPKSVYYAHRAQKRDVPVLIHSHQTAEDFKESFALSNPLSVPLRTYLRHAYSLADHLVCPSEHNQSVLKRYTDCPKTVISNGFDADRLQGHATLREEYLDRYDLDPPVVFNVGHVFKRKGLAAFIETARSLPEISFVWFGYLNRSDYPSVSVVPRWNWAHWWTVGPRPSLPSAFDSGRVTAGAITADPPPTVTRACPGV